MGAGEAQTHLSLEKQKISPLIVHNINMHSLEIRKKQKQKNVFKSFLRLSPVILALHHFNPLMHEL